MSSDNEDKTMFAMRINKSEKNELRKLYADTYNSLKSCHFKK